ncbi:hypothetical protein M501DRAFT_1018053 [Patellaria atrata CBS 101060]|uniref:NAD(P)-binding domain-containing protein n=1 Tax=Patellaria atrata CBS 101060 TaxID=1346257 RepID=A0A9P4S8H4_9PEZI|nr:hypothetical protein M501DRAFT_1018053 [Patellaria atrata CBS 101060]
MSYEKPTLAIFGSTGVCASQALALALRDGYTVTALVRTPERLRKLLSETHSIDSSLVDRNLIIVQGNVKTIADMKKTLVINNRMVDLIVCGIGGAPQFQMNLKTPFTLDDPQICESAIKTLLEAIKELSADRSITGTKKPAITVISTTGLSKTRDVPLVLYPLYYWTLTVLHIDKKIMEDLVIDAASANEISNFTIVRPTLLTKGRAKGLDNVKQEWELLNGEKGDGPGPTMGYSISRSDVGTWIFEKAIKEIQVWGDRCVSLAY